VSRQKAFRHTPNPRANVESEFRHPSGPYDTARTRETFPTALRGLRSAIAGQARIESLTCTTWAASLTAARAIFEGAAVVVEPRADAGVRRLGVVGTTLAVDVGPWLSPDGRCGGVDRR
jgi:hypothetical protein